MKAIVHIGAAKTGSSTIQEFLFQNTSALARKGFRFSRNVEGRGSQFEYAIAALARLDRLVPGNDAIRYASPDPERHKSIAAFAENELDAKRAGWREPVALFSSEHMHSWLRSAEEIRSLDALFRERFDDVRYILYIRNQEDVLISAYSEIIKRGANTRLVDFLGNRLANLDHAPGVRMWVKAVGRERFDLRLLDPDFLKDGDLLADFASACGFTLDGLEIPPRLNEGLSAAAAECIRAMNERIPEMRHDGLHNPMRKGVLQRIIAMTPLDAPRLALNEEQRALVRDKVGPGNEELRQAFFPDREVLFPDRKAGPVLDREANLEQALDLAVQLFIKLRNGKMGVLSEHERSLAIQRRPGGRSTGVAPPPSEGRGQKNVATHQ